VKKTIAFLFLIFTATHTFAVSDTIKCKNVQYTAWIDFEEYIEIDLDSMTYFIDSIGVGVNNSPLVGVVDSIQFNKDNNAYDILIKSDKKLKLQLSINSKRKGSLNIVQNKTGLKLPKSYKYCSGFRKTDFQ